MNKSSPAGFDPAYLDGLIDEITDDANGEDEQLWAFRQAFQDGVAVPCDGSVIGEPVAVFEFDYHGNERRGPTAKCRRPTVVASATKLVDCSVRRSSCALLHFAIQRARASCALRR